MRLLVGSDYHCSPALQQQALDLIPGVDGYINCGDFCSRAGAVPQDPELGYHAKGQEEVTALQQFLARIDELGKPWLFVPGNHDPSPAALSPLAGQHGYLALRSELISLLGLKVLLVPWTPPCGWNWTLTSDHLRELLATYTQPSVDLLVTHAPPLGALDEGSRWYHKNTPTLRPLVDQINPRFLLCGHMHHDGGKMHLLGSTTVVNAALHNLVIDIPDPEA